jgi:peptidyl-prolyl cis-trans isomerase D
MFEFFRTHSRMTLGFLLLLIIPSFIFFGIDGYSRFTEGGNATVAKVDGQSITRGEWDQAHQRNVERLRQQQPDLDAKLLDTPEARRQSLDLLIRQRLLLAAARDQHLAPSDARLQRLFISDPQFAGLRNPDGSVNRELLAAQGLSSELFAAQLRQDLAMQQVMGGITSSSLAPQATVAAAVEPLLQRREVQFLRFDPATLRAGITPADADIEAHYKANEASFTAPEQATIEYVVLDLESLGKGVSVPEEDLRKYYEENRSRYTQAEERRASHILIKADSSMPADARAKAKARAEALLVEVRKTPAAFAELARKNSDDSGSAANGGDLDFFGKGAMVKPFEDAAFAMKPGEIANLVETDFGYHIIKLDATRGGQAKPFEQVRPEIETEVRKSLAQRRYVEVAEQFTNTVYEQPDSLQPVIDKLKLPKLTATVQRTAPPGATGPLASAKLLDAVFSNDAINNKRNTDAVETGASQLAAARIVTHSPKRVLPLVEVKDAVRQRVVDQQAAALALKQGQDRLAELQKAPAAALTEASAITAIVSRDQAQGVPKALLDAVLSADPTKLPVLTGVDLGPQGYVLLRVTKILPREKSPEEDGNWQRQYAQIWGDAEARAMEEALKRRYKLKIDEAAVASGSAAPTAGR